jgi:hypothetical protein
MKTQTLNYLKNYIIQEAEAQNPEVTENGFVTVEFYIEEFEFFVKATLEISRFDCDFGDYFTPPSLEFNQKFENAFVEVSQDDKYFNIKTELNKLLS